MDSSSGFARLCGERVHFFVVRQRNEPEKTHPGWLGLLGARHGGHAQLRLVGSLPLPRACIGAPSRLPCASRVRRGALTAHPCADSADSTSCRVPLSGPDPPAPAMLGEPDGEETAPEGVAGPLPRGAMSSSVPRRHCPARASGCKRKAVVRAGQGRSRGVASRRRPAIDRREMAGGDHVTLATARFTGTRHQGPVFPPVDVADSFAGSDRARQPEGRGAGRASLHGRGRRSPSGSKSRMAAGMRPCARQHTDVLSSAPAARVRAQGTPALAPVHRLTGQLAAATIQAYPESEPAPVPGRRRSGACFFAYVLLAKKVGRPLISGRKQTTSPRDSRRKGNEHTGQAGTHPEDRHGRVGPVPPPPRLHDRRRPIRQQSA